MSEPHSFGSSFRYSSQSRKISIGVLVDSIPKAETKKALVQIGGNVPGTRSCVKEVEGFTPLVERNVAMLHKENSPWVSTRNCKMQKSSSVAAHDAEHAPIVPAASTGQFGSKQSVKASVNGKCGSESGMCIKRNFGTFPVEVAVADDAKNENNGISLTKAKASKVNEQLEEQNREIVADGRGSLRMKLWEILGNVSSPNKCIRSSPIDELHPQQERGEKHSLLGKRLLFSDTIESDSESPNHGLKGLVTRSFPAKKASTNTRHKRIETSKPNCPVKESPRERVFSFREECSAAFANVNDGPLRSKRLKIERQSYRVKTNQLQKHKSTEGRQQSSNKSKSKESNLSMVRKSKTEKVAVPNNRRNNASVALHSGARKKVSSKCPMKIVTELQKDDEQPREVGIPELINGQEYIKDSLFKNKRIIVHDTPVAIFEVKAPGGKHDLCPAEQLDGRQKRSNVDVVKPSFPCEDDHENGNSVSPVHATVLEKDEEDSPDKDCRESEPSSPEMCLIKKLFSGVESVENQKVVTVCTPGSETVREPRKEDTGELQTDLEQNHEDGLANAVELLALALKRIETKLKTMTSQRSAEILQATAEKISSQLQTAKSKIKLDVEKLITRGQPKKKILETKFEEQRDQLIKIYEKFEKDFDQQFQHYDSTFGDLEDHEIELKRTAEKYRAGHKRFLLEVEQEIKVHLDDAESRIIAVHKLAKERLLQLKFALAKFVEDDSLS